MSSPFDGPPWFMVDLEMLISDPRLTEVHRHWLSLGDPGAVPAAVRFDPLDLPRHLGDLFMVRADRDGADAADVTLRYSLIGTRLVEALCRDATGRTVGETFQPDHPVNELYRYMIARRVAARTHGRLDLVGKEFRRFECIIMPLADGDGRIVKFLGAAVYQ